MSILLWERIRRRLRVLFRRADVESELSDEIRLHLDMESEDLIRQGKTSAEARREARLRLGGVEQTREAVRAARVLRWPESIWQDIHYGLRQFRRAPGLFLAVVASLAIGLGANTAIFSLIDAAVLRPLPVADPDRLVQLEWRNDGMPAGVDFLMRAPTQTEDGLEGAMVSEPLYRDFSAEQTAFAALIGVVGTTDEVAISTAPGVPAQQARRHYVSGNFFDGLGVRLALGRPFVEEGDRAGAEVSIVVSHRFWSGRLGGDPDAIGRTVRINDEPARIVGVAPPGFFGLNRGEWIDVYQPLATHGFFQPEAPPPFRNYWSVTTLARLAPGVSASAAARAMTPLFRSLVAEATGMDIEERLELVARPAESGFSWRQATLDTVSEALWILMLLVGGLLLIVCANVANLLLARSEKRRRESAVRLALGAGRGRLIRQHLVESAMLAGIGGALGLVLGSVLARSIHTLFQSGQGTSDAFAVIFDWRVSAYAAAISILTAVVFGLAPAWTAARSKVNDALKIQSRSVLGGGLRLPKLLVSIQFALSFAALVRAGLLGRSLRNLYSTDLGFDAGQLSYATVRPGQAGVDRGPFMDRLEQEIAAIPGILAVAPLEARPLDEGGSGSYVHTPAGPPAALAEGIGNPEAYTSTVRGGPGFLEVLGIRLLTGRALEARDPCPIFGPGSAPASEAGTGRPICPVVVDERFAAVFFQGETPVGQRFELPNVTPAFDYEIVGLVADARFRSLREDAPPTMYYVVTTAFPMDHFAIRADIDSGALAAAVQQAVARVDPAVPLAEFHTQSGLIDRLLRTERLLALVSGAFSLAALVLAAVGLGGLLAYAVARRTNEIGIRMALGASGKEVRRMVLGDSLRMVGAGVLVGVPVAWGVGRYLESQLFGLEPIDPSTAFLALLALTVIAAMAALLPARRAARINPMTALREE
jgi:predicted permease